jgi:SHS2 domain-containing protein
MSATGRFEVLDHTADVGVRAEGTSLEECFRQATLGLLEISAAHRPGDGDKKDISVEADDLGALLVYWLDEVLYLQDSADAVVTDVTVNRVGPAQAKGSVTIAPRGNDVLEGTAVKAITYHQLAVTRTEEGWTATVFFDI